MRVSTRESAVILSPAERRAITKPKTEKAKKRAARILADAEKKARALSHKTKRHAAVLGTKRRPVYEVGPGRRKKNPEEGAVAVACVAASPGEMPREENPRPKATRPGKKMSGYTPCACRDCFDLSISDDVRKPELCSDCKAAGCEAGRGECQRPDAYGMEENPRRRRAPGVLKSKRKPASRRRPKARAARTRR